MTHEEETKRPSRQTAQRKVLRRNIPHRKYNKTPRGSKATRKLKPLVRHLPHGNPDQEWFKAHPDRIYRIRPRRDDEPGEGFLILKNLFPGGRSFVGIGPEGVMLADTDEVLGKMYDIIRSGTSAIIFPHDGSVVGEEEFGS